MLGLNATLSLASQALQAQDGAVAVTSNNIANVNTPGYTRQVVTLSAAALDQNGTSVDSGVTFGGYTSVRDQLLSIQINAKTAQQGSLTSQTSSLSAINTAFSGTTTGIGAALSTFFSSVSSLSTSPSDASARQAALSSATQLANAFHQGASDLSSAQTNASSTIVSTVSQINALSSQIAALNSQLSTIQASGGEGGSLEDQRDQLTTQLASLTGVSVIQTSNQTGNQSSPGQPTLTTGNGIPLVIGDHALALQVRTSASGLSHVLDANGNDITDSLTTGTLGGALTTQDITVPHLQTQLDTLASEFAAAINTAQAAGYDSTGAAGQPLFTVSGSHPAATLAVALTSASGIAASSDGSANSSGNLINLLAVRTSTLPSGTTPTDAYASLVSTIGSNASAISTSLSATSLSLQQLQTQQSSTSGVSTDEESANLIRYQQAYTAAAHVISTVSDLFNVVMNMGSGS